jgi:hypothetical protein
LPGKAKRGKRVSVSEFRKMWFDPGLTLADIGAALGICERAVWQRAHHRGLPARTGVMGLRREQFDDEFPAMWRYGVMAEEIAAHYGVSVSACHMKARRAGVSRDDRITRWNPGRTMAEFREHDLAERMAARAAVDRKAVAEHWAAE